MKTKALPVSLCLLLTLLAPALRAAEEPIDFEKAHAYFERRQRGETLTADEEAYIRRAMAEQRRRQEAGDPVTAAAATGADQAIDMNRAQELHRKAQAGEKLTAEEQAYYERAKASRGGRGQPTQAKREAPAPWTQHLTPLTELGTTKYKGEDGGLYGGGKNEPPKIHLDAALKESAKVHPLDADGNESDDGKIGLLSVGMSNTTQEYSRFKQLADADPAKSKRVVVIDGAQGGQTGTRWADKNSALWKTVDERLKAAGLSAKQIQVAWMKQAEAGPAQHGDFPKHAKQLQENLVKSLHNLKEKFPNLRIVYLSSRIYAGYATTGLNPEPYAYEEAFTMRWLIHDQIAGKPELNYNAAKGEVKSPLLLWGPYLWADGETPRKADGLTYTRGDLSDKDGTHPADSGRQKVADLLLKFLKTDATAKGWFTGKPSKAGAQSALAALALLVSVGTIHAADAEPPIDPARGRALMQKSSSGEKLTAEEQAYLDRVKAEIRKRAAGKTPDAAPKGKAAAPRTVAVNTNDWAALIPITDMAAPYKGEDGGLYGGGKNEPPASHRTAHLKETEKIIPRDANGEPAGEGKIGFITIGFSNPSIESEDFKRTADADAQKSPRVTIVNGCIGGRSAVMWAWDGADILPKAEQERLDKAMDTVRMPKGKRSSGMEKDTWPTLARRIGEAGLSPKQVQVAWLKHVEANPKPFGEFPAHARQLQQDITAVLQIARHHYPNLRVVYLSSRTFGGWSGRESGSPEPYAYESGFGTRWIVQSQIKGDAQLNFDPARGEVKAPLMLWGPYLWARGDSPRKFDGLTWTQNDVRGDQLHPNDSGCKKTTTLLLNFFKTNEGASRWFLKTGEIAKLLPLPK